MLQGQNKTFFENRNKSEIFAYWEMIFKQANLKRKCNNRSNRLVEWKNKTLLTDNHSR
jgi:hypothetical protein